jgi:heme/copper-type cytochrome/quinol oxidase subunit 2
MIAYKYISYVSIFTKTILFIPTVYACVSFVMANSDNFPMSISGSLYGIIATLSIPTIILLFINTINFDIFLR